MVRVNRDISTFTTWFLGEVVRIGTWIVNALDSIMLTQNVSLLDFIVTLAVIGVFLGIILTLPQNVNRYEKNYESKQKAEARAKQKEKRGKKS